MRSGWNNQQKLNILLVTKSQKRIVLCSEKKADVCKSVYVWVCVCMYYRWRKRAKVCCWINLNIRSKTIVDYNYTSVEAIQSWNEINKNVYESLTWTQPVYIDSQILMTEKYY